MNDYAKSMAATIEPPEEELPFSRVQLQWELEYLKDRRARRSREVRLLRGAMAKSKVDPAVKREVQRSLGRESHERMLRPTKRDLRWAIDDINRWAAELPPVKHFENYTRCGAEDARAENIANALQYAHMLECMIDLDMVA